eukprot:scaffold31345_cov93-Phaeocystis_antarctica.AAC.1
MDISVHEGHLCPRWTSLSTMDIDDINFGRAQMCAVGNAEPEPTPKPAAACAQCVKIGDPTGWFMKDYGKCYGGNSQCER